MVFAVVIVLFVLLFLLGLPIAFTMGLSGGAGLLIGNYPLSLFPMRLVAAAKPWVLLAIPTFVFAGLLMALRFANLSMTRQFKAYVPYILVLVLGLLITVFFPQLTLWLPRGAGLG